MSVRMKAPNGCTGCSHDNIQYRVKKGFVVVPDEIVGALYPHGFEVDGPVDDTDPELTARLAAIEAAKAEVDSAQAELDAESDDTRKAELTAVLFAIQQQYDALIAEEPTIQPEV